MADPAPAAGCEDEHTRFISSSAIEWTTKPVTGFLQVCNEPILCSEVSLHRLALCFCLSPAALPVASAAGRRGCSAGETRGSPSPIEGKFVRCASVILLADFAETGTEVQVNKWSRKLWAAVLAEFLGMTIFEIYGGNAPNSVAAYGNGITLGILGELQNTLDTLLY